MTAPREAFRVSDADLERAIIEQGDYFASFRAGIESIGGKQAKAGYDALLDLRDARAAQDAALERAERAEGIIRAHEILVAQIDKERDALRAEVAALKQESAGLHSMLERIQAERDALRRMVDTLGRAALESEDQE